MPRDDTSLRTGYGAIAKGFHWLVLALLIAQYAIAWTMPGIRRDTPDTGLVAWHLAAGSTILLAVLLRVIWRETHAVPPPPADLPWALRLISRLTHLALYGLLLLVPLLGWANASARGYSVYLLGIIRLPSLTVAGSALGHQLGGVHTIAAWALLATIGLHVSGALYHALVLRDGVIGRMLPQAG